MNYTTNPNLPLYLHLGKGKVRTRCSECGKSVIINEVDAENICRCLECGSIGFNDVEVTVIEHYNNSYKRIKVSSLRPGFIRSINNHVVRDGRSDLDMCTPTYDSKAKVPPYVHRVPVEYHVPNNHETPPSDYIVDTLTLELDKDCIVNLPEEILHNSLLELQKFIRRFNGLVHIWVPSEVYNQLPEWFTVLPNVKLNLQTLMDVSLMAQIVVTDPLTGKAHFFMRDI